MRPIFAQNHLRTMLRLYRKLAEVNGPTPRLHFYLGMVQKALGDILGCTHSLEAMQKVRPSVGARLDDWWWYRVVVAPVDRACRGVTPVGPFKRSGVYPC